MKAVTHLRTCLSTTVTIWLLAVAPVQAQQAFSSDADVLAMLDETVQTGRTAGVVVGLLDADGTRRVLAAGDGGPGALPLGGESVFEIGSISKVFTAILLADMVTRGEVELDEPIAELLPADVYVPVRNDKTITLLLVTTHHSGLPRMPDNFSPADPANPYADYSTQQMYDFISNHTLTRDPGASFEYSNYAMGLMGHALALRAGTTYEDLVTDRIFVPVGMSHSAIELTPWMETHLAIGHDAYGEPTSNWDIPTLAGAGGIRSTVDDMLDFAAANLSTSDGILYVAMDSTHRPRRQIGETASTAMNWGVYRRGERTITGHNGGTGGYRAFLGLDLDAARAVVVLTNSGGDGLDDLGRHLLDPSVPLNSPAVGLAVARAWRSDGAEAATDLYRHLSESERDAWVFDEFQLNRFGYWLLGRGELEDAIAIFELNVEAYPDAANPYDSLGEGYQEAGRLEEARDSYARAVELVQADDPNLALFKGNLYRAEQLLDGTS